MSRAYGAARWIAARLSRQLAALIACAFCLSGSLYFLLQPVIANRICDIYAANPEWTTSREAVMIDNLRAAAARDGLAATDSAALSAWVRGYPPMLLTIYRSRALLYDSAQYTSSVLHAHIAQPALAERGASYTVSFADGDAQVALSTFPEHTTSDLFSRALLVVCAALFLCVVLLGMRRKVRSLVRLELETLAIAGGETDRPITVSGDDELAELARSVDGMRASLLSSVKESDGERQERDAWAAALSHDLRTPLTALRGYLEVLLRLDPPGAARVFAQKSAAQADRIKGMSDMLFSCFTGAPIPAEELRGMSAEELRVNLDERAGLLREKGLSVSLEMDAREGVRLRVRREALERVLDNAFGNLASHANPLEPIAIKAEYVKGAILLSIENTRKDIDGSGQKLGLTICENLMRAMGGAFETVQHGDTFCVRVSIAYD
ncbi:MAG: HAMP domain-containing histidine kinase [Oscillospiraceae bacterium]|nr:HAMP domain-containing histidine kinase [Oscillospiraceae bacterium]